MISNNQNIGYRYLNEILHGGWIHDKEPILGIDKLKRKYFEEWYKPDEASKLSYDDKIKKFDVVLRSVMEDKIWLPTYFEMSFEFVWDNRVIIHGLIDRIDINALTGSYKTVDYKTSKKAYDKSKLATSLQFGIYALAVFNKFGTLPEQSEYHFVLIDEVQQALTKGWEARLIKALDKSFDSIETCERKNVFLPKPSPLCFYCNYCRNNPHALKYKDECQYYSKWTPSNRIFDVNKKWNTLENNAPTIKERKLVF